MKSKISFFNKTIFKKNITLYWPIWVFYTLFLVFVQPVMFWSSCYYSQFDDQYTYQDKLEAFIEVIYLDLHIYIIAFVALASGMALFHYLYNAKSANMIHAFPVDRTQLFGTNVISGILFLAVPQTISSILLAILALANGVSQVHYVLYWWLLVLGADIVAIGVVTFCAMFTGHIMALPVYAVIVNYFAYLVHLLITVPVSLFGFGISNFGDNAQRIVILFSPTECFMYNVGLIPNFDEARNCTGAMVYGVKFLVVYLLVAAVLYVAAYFIYKKRHVEQAGEFITVEWVKPIFRFGVALAGGYIGSILTREFLRGIGIGCNMMVFIILLLLFGAVAFFAADMLIHKSFHVFKIKNWKHCGICMAAMLVTFFGVLGAGKQFEDYQPELAEIERATINWGYEIRLEGEEAAKVLAIHKEILENRDICMRASEKAREYLEYVNIRYELENGEIVHRYYQIPVDYEETYAVLKQIAELEMDPENYLSNLFRENYEEIEEFKEGWLEACFADDFVAEQEWDMIEFTPEECKEMYHAIIADVEAGNLMKYNVTGQWMLEEQKADTEYSWEAYIRLMFKAPNGEEEIKTKLEEYSYTYPGGTYVEEIADTETWYSADVTIGPDCENIINKMIEIGAIESAEDIYRGGYVEE